MFSQQQIQLGLSLQEQLQLEEAKEVFEQILSQDNRNIEVIDYYTDTLEQLDQIELMENILKQILVEQNQNIIENYPSGYKLLFKYASTKNGKSKYAISFYQIGIKLIEKQILLQPGEKSLLKDIADAYAAIAELYQTDLLDFKESVGDEGIAQLIFIKEQEVVNNINLALKYDATNLDAFFQLANYHLFKEQEDLAVKELRVVYERLMLDEEDQYTQDFKLQFQQTCKLLVEVDHFNESKKLLRKAVDQNDKNIEILYMLAFCLWKLKEYPEAYKICQGLINMEETKEDEVQIRYMQTAIQEIQTATEELIVELEKQELLKQETGNENENEEEWMDIE